MLFEAFLWTPLFSSLWVCWITLACSVWEEGKYCLCEFLFVVCFDVGLVLWSLFFLVQVNRLEIFSSIILRFWERESLSVHQTVHFSPWWFCTALYGFRNRDFLLLSVPWLAEHDYICLLPFTQHLPFGTPTASVPSFPVSVTVHLTSLGLGCSCLLKEQSLSCQ